MGAHHSQSAETDSRPTPLVAWLAIVPVAVITLVAMIWLWPPEPAAPDPQQSPAEQVNGTVTAVETRECTEVLPGEGDECGTARVLLDDGSGAPREVVVALSNRSGAPEVAEGDEVVLIGSSDPGQEVYAIVDHQRGTGLWVLVAAFSLALVAFGRWHGLRALAGLAVTFAVLLFFVVPAILAGEPPVLVAIVGSGAIVLTVLYLTHGFALSTTVALSGILVSLVLTGLLSAGAVAALHLTGVTDDLTASVGLTQGVNTEGLLVAGIVIGSLGVLDDVTVTQAATVAESRGPIRATGSGTSTAPGTVSDARTSPRS